MKKVISYVTTEQDAGRRLEWILKRRLELSAQEISQAKFRRDGICVNGLQCKVSREICAGDLVEVCLEEETRASDQLIPKPGSLEILYEDEDVLVVNKPAGIVCHPVGGHYQDTLANVMQYYFGEQKQQVVIRLIGRLDQETSGVVLAAKSQAAASRLNRQKEQGILKKEYLALVEGCPKKGLGSICDCIGPISGSGDADSRDAIRMQVCADGKKAVTHYEVLETTQKGSLVRLQLDTGRTHQIRVHMAHLGCPLLGDTLYNEKARGGGEIGGAWERAALHAFHLTFVQPFSGEIIDLEAPLPGDFIKYLREGGFFYVAGVGGSDSGHCADHLYLSDGSGGERAQRVDSETISFGGA